MNMTDISTNLKNIRKRIDLALESSDRVTKDVILVAASKGQSSEAIRVAYECGQRHFGENYLQEAQKKQCELADLSDICWHFIGPIQSNKTSKISNNFDWVHTVDRLKIAQRLSGTRDVSKPLLNICVQVNVSKEITKSGVSLHECTKIANIISAYPRLNLRGLMTMPKSDMSDEAHKEVCETMSKLLLETRINSSKSAVLDTLSMGMSSDFERAIKEGATIVRLGSAIFGARKLLK
jgi:pyridoxal phosphate enzyme (YggS family)